MLTVAALASCGQKPTAAAPEAQEDSRAMELFQGIWIDNETEMVVFRVEGDTVFYPDATSMPSHFSIVGDTLLMGEPPQKYPIQRQSAETFWFRNTNGDLIKLAKSRDTVNVLAFRDQQPRPMAITEVVKRDTVVVHRGERYHCYVAINPTKYKVVRTAYNDDGVAVDNIYYDNIIHISVYQATSELYSQDFRKSMFAALVPEHFLSQAILSDMSYSHVDDAGLHFNASLCLPDAASCYVVDTAITPDGQMSMKLVD